MSGFCNCSVRDILPGDVRTLAISGDAWQGLAVSTNRGTSFDFEALVSGFPGDTSPEGLASPIRGNQAASDPWLSFDNFGNLFFAFIAFQRTPPGRPDFDPADTNAIAVARYIATSGGVQYGKTVLVEREPRPTDVDVAVERRAQMVVDALFQPFQRGSRNDHADGHGLGLSIVAAIAAAHNADFCASALPAGGLMLEIRFHQSPATMSGANRLSRTSSG